MTQLVGNKVEAYGLVDVLAMAGIKQLEERITAPYIGNATLKSGVIKLLIGGVGYGLVSGNKYGKLGASAVVFDGAEDIMRGVLGRLVEGEGNTAAVSDNW